MSPELPPAPDRDPRLPEDDDRLGPEAAASVERSLAHLTDPDDALRILHGLKENGAAFAAYLLLDDTNLAAENLTDTFHDAYVDAWETFAEFRRDVLEGLGWLDAVKKVMDEQGIPKTTSPGTTRSSTSASSTRTTPSASTAGGTSSTSSDFRPR